MSNIEAYKIILITSSPDSEKEKFKETNATIIDRIVWSNYFNNKKEMNSDGFEAFVEHIGNGILSREDDKLLVLIHGSEKERFLSCMELRNLLKGKFPNTYFFTYSIGGRGNPHHYGFVLDKDKYASRNYLLEDLQVYNTKIDEVDLSKFRSEFLENLDLGKPISYYQYSTYYPSNSGLPTNIEEKHTIENRFYNEGVHGWDYKICFRDELLCEYNYPLGEHKKFYYTEEKTKNSDYDMRRYFYDSSIWFRYMYSVDGQNQKKEIRKYLKKYEDYLKLTASSVTKFFHIRMFENSFVIGGNNSHGQHIIPFRFHSETLMENGAKAELKKINTYLKATGLKSWKWNIELLDDYANIALKGKDAVMKFTSGEYNNQIMSKNNIVRHTLGIDNNGDIHLHDTKITLNIKCKEDFPDPLLNKDWYDDYSNDILLIDYLFTLHTKDGKHRFGDEVVKYFVRGDSDGPPKCKSATGKNWVFPVSAFNFVFTDSLSSQGIDYFGTDMILSQGGDPITTPNLFRYRFYKFLRLQLEEYGVNSGERIKDHLQSMKAHIVDVIFKDYETKGDNEKKEIENTKKEYVKEMFPTIVDLVAKYRLFLKQVNLMNLNIGNTAFGSGIFISEGVQTFVYKVAYGGIEDNNTLQAMLENLSDTELRAILNKIWKGNE